MDANERVINRLERLYSLYGASDLVDSVREHRRPRLPQGHPPGGVPLHQHASEERPARSSTTAKWTWSTGDEDKRQYPIDPEKLRVFPKDADLPKDQLNTTIDQHFVPMAKVEPPGREYEAWKNGWPNCAG